MILQPCNVELTKVHYYDRNKLDRNVAIPTISREIDENDFNRNVIIKRNVFGHRWVLKLNEEDAGYVEKKSKVKVVVYFLVFCSIVVAVCFGIFFSIERKLLKDNVFVPGNVTVIKVPNNTRLNHITEVITSTLRSIINGTIENSGSVTEKYRTTEPPPFCSSCRLDREVCIKISETERPKCVEVKNSKDPTGCGGLCQINTHYCQILDSRAKVYQCSLLRNILKCPPGSFSCGNMCVSEEKRCDGSIDCSNRSDEENCDCDQKTHFHCGNSTSCLEKRRRCDRTVDCWDKSDEVDCAIVSNCTKDEISCYNGQCIQRTEFCDGKFDCADGTDEPNGCETEENR